MVSFGSAATSSSRPPIGRPARYLISTRPRYRARSWAAAACRFWSVADVPLITTARRVSGWRASAASSVAPHSDGSRTPVMSEPRSSPATASRFAAQKTAGTPGKSSARWLRKNRRAGNATGMIRSTLRLAYFSRRSAITWRSYCSSVARARSRYSVYRLISPSGSRAGRMASSTARISGSSRASGYRSTTIRAGFTTRAGLEGAPQSRASRATRSTLPPGRPCLKRDIRLDI